METVEKIFLEEELNSLKKALKYADRVSTDVSKKGVDWHIDHSLKVIIGISKLLIKSDPQQYKWKFNLSRFYIFSNKSIPRGTGKSPKAVISEGDIDSNDLISQIKEAESLSAEIMHLPENSNFTHQYFGMLNLSMSKKFMKIHTNHHLKIIRDIIRQ